MATDSPSPVVPVNFLNKFRPYKLIYRTVTMLCHCEKRTIVQLDRDFHDGQLEAT